MKIAFTPSVIVISACLMAGLSGIVIAPTTHAASPISSLLESIFGTPQETTSPTNPPQQVVPPVTTTPTAATPVATAPSTAAPEVASTDQTQTTNAASVPVQSTNAQAAMLTVATSPSTGARIVGTIATPSAYADQQASLLANPRTKAAGTIVATGFIVIGSLLLLLARRSYTKVSLGFPRFLSAARQSSR